MKEITSELFFETMRLMSALKIKDDIKDIARESSENGVKDQFTLGYELIMRVIDKAVQVEAEDKIYAFISKVIEKPIEDIRTMKFTALIDELLETIDVEEWKSLFTRVASLLITPQ